MGNKAATVDEYIAGFSGETRVKLEQMRSIVHNIAPEAVETISYGMPAYKWHGILVYFAGYDKHIGLYALPTANEYFRKKLATYKTGKGSVQFPVNQNLPEDLISSIIEFRMKENKDKSGK